MWLIGRTGNIFGERYRLVTLMRTASGLVPGAAVQLAGQTVGQVARIELIDPGRRPESGEAVAIWLAIDRAVQAQIRADSRARTRTQGLLGDRVIDIRPGSAEAPVLQPGDTILAGTAPDFDRLLENGAAAVAELADVTANLAELTRGLLEGQGTLGQMVVDDTLYERMVSLAAGLDRFLDLATSRESTVGRLLHDDSLYASLAGAVIALDSLTSGLVRGEGTLGRLMTSDSLYRALSGVAVTSDSLLASLQEGEGSAGKLFSDPRLYEELLRTVTDLNALLREVRENPERYVPPVEIF